MRRILFSILPVLFAAAAMAQTAAQAASSEALKTQLVSDEVSSMKYDGEKPQALLDEDKVIGSMRLGIKPGQVTIVPVESVFAN